MRQPRKTKRVLFARIGWMKFYRGPQPGDERPTGGGSYTKENIGHECYNFKPYGDDLRGFVQPALRRLTQPGGRKEKVTLPISLRRIGPQSNEDDLYVDNVLVIFFARKEGKGRQVIVGWYSNANVCRDRYESDWKGRGDYTTYNMEAAAREAVLLPPEKRQHMIPQGKGAAGRSQVTYALETDGTPKRAQWIQTAIDYVLSYNGPNLLVTPEEGSAHEIGLVVERDMAYGRGQGFKVTPEVRDALEKHSMRRAATYFKKRGFEVENASKTESFDLLCRKKQKCLRVEVKGTQSVGYKVHLTPNEVLHARAHRKEMALYVLHSVKVARHGKGAKASGGKERVICPWNVDKGHLKPVSYMYELPGGTQKPG